METMNHQKTKYLATRSNQTELSPETNMSKPRLLYLGHITRRQDNEAWEI